MNVYTDESNFTNKFTFNLHGIILNNKIIISQKSITFIQEIEAIFKVFFNSIQSSFRFEKRNSYNIKKFYWVQVSNSYRNILC
jgi:hypothetical protein